MGLSLIDLPDMQFGDDDVGVTLQNLITTYEAISGRTLYPGDPVRIFLHAIALIIVQQRVLINQTARSNLLRYATGAMLDHMGAFSGTTRLPSEPARTTLRFTLSAPQMAAVSIPAGTRVSNQSNPKLYFATTAYAEILPGQTYVDAVATCTTTGTSGNGFLAGQINQIVDLIPFVLTAVNQTTSAGGADTEADEAIRQRIYTAPESFSVAGPDGAYQYWAKTANPGIIDVSVNSPAPGEVLVIPLMAGGEIPSSDILDVVEEICSSKTVRPLTDLVTVEAPTTKSYTVSLTYWIDRSRASEVTAIQTAVTAAVSSFVIWQKSKLGRDINPSELISRIVMAGALRVNVTNPVYSEVELSEIAVASTITVNYGGLSDD